MREQDDRAGNSRSRRGTQAREAPGRGPRDSPPWGAQPSTSVRHGLGQSGGRPSWTGERVRGPRVKRGDVRAAALALLAEEPRNGYQIMQEIAARSSGVWQPSPGSVYPALQQLEGEGLIRAVGLAGGRSGFTITGKGQAHMAAHTSGIAAPWEAVADREHGPLREMRALIGQLSMAASHVTNAGTDAQVAQAQRILCDARRGLYRLLAAGEDQ